MCSATNSQPAIALELMTTSGCHLCDEAIQLIVQVIDADNFTVDLVDIAFDDVLMENYATKIPVLVCPEQKKELGWPFDLSQLSDYAQQLLSNRITPS